MEASRAPSFIPHILRSFLTFEIPSFVLGSYFLTFSRRQITGLRKSKGPDVQQTVKTANTTSSLHRRFIPSTSFKIKEQQFISNNTLPCRVIVYIRHSYRASVVVTLKFIVHALPPPPSSFRVTRSSHCILYSHSLVPSFVCNLPPSRLHCQPSLTHSKSLPPLF